MLLERLVAYAERLKLPPTLYAEGPVRYLIDLDANGALLSPGPIDLADPSSARTKRGQRRFLPQVQRSSAVKPLLLADKPDYVLGHESDDGRAERTRKCHASFVALVRRCVEETQEPAVQAVLDFLENDSVATLVLPEDFDPGGVITFRVEGVFPIDLPSVQAFWAKAHDPDLIGARSMQCLVCGEQRPALSRLQSKVKGVPGGQTSGTSLISANANAFESYGLEASQIAPTCATCAERFTKALNELLADEKSHVRIGNAVFAFWTREPSTGFSFRAFLTDPKPEEVRALATSVRSGRIPREVVEDRFYAVWLSASGGRTVVRDWLDASVGEIQRHLVTWFSWQEIESAWGDEGEPLGIYALSLATVRDPRDLSPTAPRSLLHAALTGTPVPLDLLFQAVKRNQAEQSVTRPRSSLIKLVLRSHALDEEDRMVRLDRESDSLGYHCGRLLAVLEETQKLAVPGIKATVVDRFFGTASSAPASVFGRLVRGAQPHLGKLERDNRGAAIVLQRRLEDILGQLPAFPKTLSLEEQGRFALGYYHQRAADRAEAREKANARAIEKSTNAQAVVE